MTDRSGPFVGMWAVVTGASRNIGAAIASALADAGADLVISARNLAPLEEVANRIATATGRRVIPVAADVTSASDRVRLVDTAQRESGGAIGVLVNNAYDHASTIGTDILALPDDAWDRAIAANLRAPYDLCRQFGIPMRSRGQGAIINVVAGPGLLPAAGWAPYGVTTAGLWMLTRYLAMECAPSVRVNAVCPGTIHPATENRAYAREVMLSQVPMGRIGRPEEVAGAVVHLASPGSSYTTGALLTVNGGRLW
jgi:NAD(P)-dependent dehydrogenase (short-subunit alcohol dehydrogenase family)